MDQISELATRYRELEAKSKELKKQLDGVNSDWTDAETQLLDAMVEAGVPSIKLAGIGLFSISNRVFISYSSANKDAVMQYLKESGNGELIKEDIMKAAFGDFVDPHFEKLKAQYEEQGFDQVDARKKALEFLKSKGFNEFTKKTISVRKA